jgi:hypothetical protein
VLHACWVGVYAGEPPPLLLLLLLQLLLLRLLLLLLLLLVQDRRLCKDLLNLHPSILVSSGYAD